MAETQETMDDVKVLAKGYKVVDKNMMCHGYTYEVGKWHDHEGTVALCNRGFHFCLKLTDVQGYKDMQASNRLFEVEAGGVVLMAEDDTKCVTSRIRLVREIPWKEVYELSNCGNRNTGVLNTGDENIGDRNSGDGNLGASNAGCRNMGFYNAGHDNIGNRNVGSFNNGDDNSGDHNHSSGNAGNKNDGYRNAGDLNFGNTNAGSRNAGSLNAGCANVGNHNQGNKNAGDGNHGNANAGQDNKGNYNWGTCNMGNWNKGTHVVGYLSTKEAPFMMFDQPCDVNPAYVSYPSFLYKLCPVVDDAGKTAVRHDRYDDPLDWHRVVRIAKWGREIAWERELERLRALPNFSYESFERVSGVTKDELLGPAECDFESDPPGSSEMPFLMVRGLLKFGEAAPLFMGDEHRLRMYDIAPSDISFGWMANLAMLYGTLTLAKCDDLQLGIGVSWRKQDLPDDALSSLEKLVKPAYWQMFLGASPDAVRIGYIRVVPHARCKGAGTGLFNAMTQKPGKYVGMVVDVNMKKVIERKGGFILTPVDDNAWWMEGEVR